MRHTNTADLLYPDDSLCVRLSLTSAILRMIVEPEGATTSNVNVPQCQCTRDARVQFRKACPRTRSPLVRGRLSAVYSKG